MGSGRRSCGSDGVTGGLLVSGHAAPHRAQYAELHKSDDETLIAEVRRLGNLDAEACDIPELRELPLPVLRTDYRPIENHRPQHPGRVRRRSRPTPVTTTPTAPSRTHTPGPS
ncbi:thioesterase domain-containing protein [Streptomyces sp. NPDC048483]|uniref:thioesterase domain-containing protein n=1 Tax=Streptomyces sp. NPDC048483 TaxID=3154927 RepID=UPI003423E67D